MPAHEAINGTRRHDQNQATIPSIALNANSPTAPGELPPLSEAEVAILWRILQDLPSRRLKKRAGPDTVVISSPHNKDEYQRLWREEINDHLVNHPSSQLRKLFKRPQATTIPRSRTTSPARSTATSDPEDRVQLPQRRIAKPPNRVLQNQEPLTPASSEEDRTQNPQRQLDQRLSTAAQSQNATNGGINTVAQNWEADKVKLEHVFLHPRVWKSWQYKYAYPRLNTFLANADHENKSRCEVMMRDFPYDEEENCLDEWNSIVEEDTTRLNARMPRAASELLRRRLRLQRQTMLNHERLWERIRSRFKMKGQQNYVLGRRDSSYMIPCRGLQIVDLSPICACLLLESCARMDLSYVAMFIERYLTNTNWATVNLTTNTGPNSKLRNYLFEYHISFYHVTSGRTNYDYGYGDERNARQASPFTAGPKAKARRIFEEQLSFITIGHGGDVYTNIQLAEKYSCDPNDDLYESPFWNKRREDSARRFEGENRGITFFVSHLKPSSAFLAWIANSMRHVVARWQTAISAVDREIDSSFQATFHGDKHSLLADDSSFSRSKKYVWAIQVYGVFYKKLDDTIQVWKVFEKTSFDRLDQDQLVTHKEESLTIIKAAVVALEMKRDHVKDKRGEVSDMKEGLFATSQLLDSRNTVTQNENIRLLTYINLLFLPLAFCTSIFGMQTILPSHVHGVYFAVTICVVTIFTIFMVFNLQIILEILEGLVGKATKWLRRLMAAHHRRHWHKTAQALQTSREARNIIVQNRLRRNSAWMYFVFLLEVFFVMIPIREIEAARQLWGLRRPLKKPKPATSRRPGITGIPTGLQQDETTSIARVLGLVILSVVRSLFLPLWLILVALEVVFVSTYLLLSYATHVFHQAAQSPKRSGVSTATTPSEKRKRKPHPFRIPLQLLGFFRESEVRLPPNIQRKIQRWRGIVADSQGNALEIGITSLEADQPWFMSKSDIAAEESQQARNLPTPSPSPPLRGGLRVPSAEAGTGRGRRMSEGNIDRSARHGHESEGSSISPRPSPTRARTSSVTFLGLRSQERGQQPPVAVPS